ncbi:hypothetical protein [Parafrankia discariae]|uniref:hypothetical protein n=1 Tax=Parafrankia discariae TaxID=365528 RepID=UPI000686818E|nr:hypothetical protein [Parafrankia discariae]
MTVLTSIEPGTDLSVGDLVVVGVGLTVAAACLGRLRAAFVLGVPTLLLAGGASILGWLLDGTGGGGNTVPPAQGPPIDAAITGGGTRWGAFLLTVLGAVLIVLGTVVWASWSRRHGERFENGNEAGPVRRPDPTAPRWTHSDLPVSLSELDDDSYPDLPSQHRAPPDPNAWAPEIAPSDGRESPTGGFGQPRSRRNHRDQPADPFFENIAARIDRIVGLYLNAVTPRPGRPARVDLLAPDAQYFISALTTTLDLFGGTAPADRMEPLVEAVREVERRWDAVIGIRIGPNTPDETETSRAPAAAPRPATAPRHRPRIPPRPAPPPRPVLPPVPGGANSGGDQRRRRLPGEHPGRNHRIRPEPDRPAEPDEPGSPDAPGSPREPDRPDRT